MIDNDGDFHIRLRVDPQFVNMINSANVNGQFGDLVLEPICQNPVTQPDAVAACTNLHQSINIPRTGTHVTVTGSYVHDLDHGGWSEIHPVSSNIYFINILTSSSPLSRHNRGQSCDILYIIIVIKWFYT